MVQSLLLLLNYLPGQVTVPHCRVSVAGPVHCLPPLDGGGLVQLRFLVWDPPLQVTEQGPQALQSDQPPFTEMDSNEKRNQSLFHGGLYCQNDARVFIHNYSYLNPKSLFNN